MAILPRIESSPVVEPAAPVLPAPIASAVLLSPLLFLKLRMAWAIVTTSEPVLRPSMSPSFISIMSALMVAVGLESAEFSPIWEMAASTTPNWPGASLAAMVVLMSVGMVVIISTPLKPKAVATAVFLAAMAAAMVVLLPLLVFANW